MLGIVLTSRNNYELLERVWHPSIKTTCPILNIDDGSDKHDRRRGQVFCEKNGIRFLRANLPGVEQNIRLACDYFESENVEYLVWFQHDCYPLQPDFFDQLTKICKSGFLKNFGCFGFNGLATDVCRNYPAQFKQLRRGKKPIGLLARSPLETGYSWYSGFKTKKYQSLAHPELFKDPCAIESTAWFASGVCISQFKKHIVPDSNFRFFASWDDICFQFLKNNVHNIVLPELYVAHRPDLKPNYGFSRKSVNVGKQKKPKMYGRLNPNAWCDKWKWDWNDRSTFANVRHMYSSTLLESFFDHNPDNGPLKTFL